MRKRRLYRYMNPQAMMNPRLVIQKQAELSEFDRGVQHGITVIMQQQERMAAEAHRAALMAAKHEPYLIMARRNGFDEGFRAGSKSIQNQSNKDLRFTYSDLEEARARGFSEGKAVSRSQVANANESSIRRKAIDDMMENCRVIAESNPNMTSDAFYKAVLHRSKKL